MVEPQSEPVFPVGFDDDALEDDLAHLPASAEETLRAFHKELRGANAMTVYEAADRRLNS